MKLSARAFLIAIGVCIAVPAAADPLTVDLCEYWPLAEGNRWDGVPPLQYPVMECLGGGEIAGHEAFEMRILVTGASDLPTTVSREFVSITTDGLFLESSLEALASALQQDEPLFPSPITDGEIVQIGDRDWLFYVDTLEAFALKMELDIQDAPIPSTTLCIAITLDSPRLPALLLAEGYGLLRDPSVGFLTANLKSAATCVDRFRPQQYSGDTDSDEFISLPELLRAIQFFNSGGYDCAAYDQVTEDGRVPGPGLGSHECFPTSYDYAPQDWQISLNELLRVIQFYNAGGVYPCPDAGTEDGFCPGQQN